ncbi:MAG: MraY family glycosyltransferase [Opitutales bacterium]
MRTGLGCSAQNQGQYHHTHTGFVPRIGGVGIVFGFVATYLLSFFLFDGSDNKSTMHYSVFAGGVAAFLLGFIDDIKPLGAKVKLLTQIIIALFAHHGGLQIEVIRIPFIDLSLNLGFFGIFVTVFWVVALMNLINLIDGLDGLAGGVGLMLMCLLAYLAYEGAVFFSLILSLGMCGAILGFLFHNFPPAKVYMGDSGAYLIGYVIATISLLNAEKGSVLAALIAPVLALALPICDVAFAIMRRGLKGMPLFRPDRGHIHHRLMSSGLSRQRSVLVLYAISLLALVAGLLAFTADGRYLPIFLGILFLTVLLFLRRQRMSPQKVGRIVNESWQARQDTKNALKLRDWFVLEAGRADTGEHLWSDFQFVLRKIGFCRAHLRIGQAERSFFIPHSQHSKAECLWQEIHEMEPEVELILYADKDFFSERQFAIIADIAGEAWAGAMKQWCLTNGEPLTFASMAKEPENYREQKTRNLYRPTY